MESSNTGPPREVRFRLEFDFAVMLDDYPELEEVTMMEESVRLVGMVPAS